MLRLRAFTYLNPFTLTTHVSEKDHKKLQVRNGIPTMRSRNIYPQNRQ